jgi:drug/metabolite transporter (DMT)-like permease
MNTTAFSQHGALWATLGATVLWSVGGLFIKILPQGALTILCYRSFYASIIFWIIFRNKLLKINTLSWISAGFYAALLIFFVNATKLTTAANAIFLQYTAPAIVLLLEPYLVKTRLTTINILTVVFTFAGMLLFFVDEFSAPDNMLGIGLGIASGFMLAGLLISQKINRSEYQPGAVFLGNIIVCVVTLPWFFNSPWPTLTENSYLMIMGFGQIGLGYALFVYGQKYLPALESSLISMLEPVLNPVWVFIGYGEFPGWWAITGGALILVTLTVRMIILEKKKHLWQV